MKIYMYHARCNIWERSEAAVTLCSYFQPAVRLKMYFQRVHVHGTHIQHIFTDTLRWWHRSQMDTFISHTVTDCMNDLIPLPSLSEQDEDKIVRGKCIVYVQKVHMYIYIYKLYPFVYWVQTLSLPSEYPWFPVSPVSSFPGPNSQTSVLTRKAFAFSWPFFPLSSSFCFTCSSLNHLSPSLFLLLVLPLNIP